MPLTRTDHGPLSVGDVVALATMFDLMNARRVKYLPDDSDDILLGVPRSVGDERGNFLGRDDDVRDAYLRITRTTGFEHFVPVADVMRWVHEGRIASDD